jgi:hypothetical protein
MKVFFVIKRLMILYLHHDSNLPGRPETFVVMFVLNPDPYSLPSYRIGPFRTRDLAINHSLPESCIIDDYFNARFDGKEFIYTENGRQAISYALKHYNLRRDDVVTILTTTNNFYISGCVTTEIEKYCQWSRKIVPETRLIFVNHEFGYPFPGLKDLLKLNIPIIEDCASSFFSQDISNSVGNTGDFVIYSFPKMFPIQIGGLLVSNKGAGLNGLAEVEGEKLIHIKSVLSNYIESEKEVRHKRIFNYKYLKSKFESLGASERFITDINSLPGVFMFKTEKLHLNLPDLKLYFYSHGVQCSVFYGEEAFFIPVHQALEECDLDYFYEIFKSFLNRSAL